MKIIFGLVLTVLTMKLITQLRSGQYT